MDTKMRNELTLSFENLAWWTIHRNARLLHALNLEYEDVFQNLMIEAMLAIDGFNPERSDSLFTHVRCKMYYSILEMRRKHKPCGLTGARRADITFVTVNSYDDIEAGVCIECHDDYTQMEAEELFDLLDAHEQNAVSKKTDGYQLQRRKEKEALQSAREKIESLYLAELQYA